MAAGRLTPLTFLLLLSLHLGLGWGSDPQGAPTAEEISFEEMAETGGTWKPQGNNHVRLPRALAGPCQLWSLTLPVAELGLGYASEEKVIFRYCAGSCPREARTQHSLVLARLRGQGRAHGRPCCRPTSYADVTFLDDRHRWQQLPQLSAAACGCGG
ncbi:Pspn [Lemmus lemmus]